MKRWVFNVVCSCSFILLVGSIAMWIRSEWVTERFAWVTRSQGADGTAGEYSLHAITSTGGWACYWWRDDMFVQIPPTFKQGWDHWERQWYHDHTAGRGWSGLGRTGRAGRISSLVIPYWLAAACTAILPLTWLLPRAIRVRRGQSGRCPKCGYDLRATPGRCPECGNEPADATAFSTGAGNNLDASPSSLTRGFPQPVGSPVEFPVAEHQ